MGRRQGEGSTGCFGGSGGSIARAVAASHFPAQAGLGTVLGVNAALAIPYKHTAHWKAVWYHPILQMRRLSPRWGGD